MSPIEKPNDMTILYTPIYGIEVWKRKGAWKIPRKDMVD
jgi:hypothetical protein